MELNPVVYKSTFCILLFQMQQLHLTQDVHVYRISINLTFLTSQVIFFCIGQRRKVNCPRPSHFNPPLETGDLVRTASSRSELVKYYQNCFEG
jgi:hypothetical protein